jgi:hypothetical protein
VSATERRIRAELASGDRFLVLDFGREATNERRALLGGATIARRMETSDLRGRTMSVPSARVHHWRGDVLLPGVRLASVIEALQRDAPPPSEDVLASRVLDRGPGRMKVYLRLQRQRIVTVVYNTEHEVVFAGHGSRRATSTSTATKIAEVMAPDTTDERELPPGEDRGFLWRLRSHWRYEEVDGGVIAECESLSLSRDVPSVVRYLVNPLIESTARESMERTLLSLRSRFAAHHP